MFQVQGADRLARVLDRLGRVGSASTVQRVADLMVRRTKQRFIIKRDPEDEPWKERVYSGLKAGRHAPNHRRHHNEAV